MARRRNKWERRGAAAADFTCGVAGSVLRNSGKVIAGTCKGTAKLIASARKKKPGKNVSVAPRVASEHTGSRFKPLAPEMVDAKFEDVAGLEEVKQILEENVINPFLFPETYARFQVASGGGVLLYGPPGCGKTFIARAIASQLGAAFYSVNPADIKSSASGETERRIQELFQTASRHEKVVLFFDEIDALLSRRGSRKINAVTQFLALSDGLMKIENCTLLIGATNKPWSVDEAALRPGRFSNQIYVGLPEPEAREAIIKTHLRNTPQEDALISDQIINLTEGYSGADLAHISKVAKKQALNRQLESGKDEQICSADLLRAIQETPKSVFPELVEEYTDWLKKIRQNSPKQSQKPPVKKSSGSIQGEGPVSPDDGSSENNREELSNESSTER